MQRCGSEGPYLAESLVLLTHTRAHTHMCTRTHTHSHIYTHMHSLACICTLTYTCSHMHMYSHRKTHMYTHTLMYTCSHICTYTPNLHSHTFHIGTYAYTCAHSHTYIRMHIPTYTYTYSLTHTCRHLHAFILSLSGGPTVMVGMDWSLGPEERVHGPCCGREGSPRKEACPSHPPRDAPLLIQEMWKVRRRGARRPL